MRKFQITSVIAALAAYSAFLVLVEGRRVNVHSEGRNKVAAGAIARDKAAQTAHNSHAQAIQQEQQSKVDAAWWGFRRRKPLANLWRRFKRLWRRSSPCEVGKSTEGCAKYLNEHYLSYDPDNPRSRPGVVLRGQPRFGEWLYCTGKCYKGQADCIVSASLLNHRIMITSDNRPKTPMDHALGIIFEPDAFTGSLAKCYYEFDGASWNRLNGGCGRGAGNSCDDTRSAFANVCPSTKEAASKPGCPEVENEACDKLDGELPKYPRICHWKGPAYYSSASPGEEPDLTPSGFNQLREMLDQRISHQDGSCGGHPCNEYWNEMVIDGKILKKMLADNAASVIAAFSYRKGDHYSFNEATKFNAKLKQEWNKTVPIVALDLHVQVSASEGRGPFSAPEW